MTDIMDEYEDQVEYKHRLKNDKNNKTILTDLNDLSIPEEIKLKADELYKYDGCPNHRGKPRKLMIFTYLYMAYNELEFEYVPLDIANLLGIKFNEISSAVKYIQNEKYQIVIKTPLNYVNYLANLYNFSDQFREKFRNYLEKIYLGNELDFDDYAPYMVTIVAFITFCHHHGIVINKQNILTYYRSTDTNFKELEKLIEKVYNSVGNVES